MTDEVTAKVRKASKLLKQAYEESSCRWCARNLDKLSRITSDMAEISPYTAETAKRVSSKTQEELDEVGSKVKVLRDVVRDAANDGNITDVKESIYNEDYDDWPRGLFMDKKTATMAALGAAVIGGGGGWALNRVNEMVTPGQPFYMSVGPWANIIGGIVLTYASGMKRLGGGKMSTFVLGGGLGMLSNGTRDMIEGAYRMTVPAGMAMAPGRRYVNARVPSMANPVRVVQTTRSF